MRRYFSTLFLGAVLCFPVVMNQARAADQRYYDSAHHDYHTWNSDEDRAWKHWLEVNHHEYHQWAKASKREQRDYWQWRHDHPDWH